MRSLIFLAAFVVLGACAGTGPSTSAITKSAVVKTAERKGTEPYILINVDSAIAERVSSFAEVQSGFFRNVSAGTPVIGVGDTIQVSIISWSGEGFVDFTTSSISPMSATNLPPQEVNSAGSITVPPLGRVLARGKTVQQFENLLERRLGDILVDPSVVVTLQDRQSARVSLIGSVNGVGTRPMNAVDTRLVDVIVSQGGPIGKPEDLVVKLSRRGQTATVPLDTLFENSRYNISVLPGDVISVEPPSKELVVLGATGTSRTVFEESSVSLTEALAGAGGLLDRTSDRNGVFLYRQASRKSIESLGINAAHLRSHTIPTIFRFDFTDPSIFFIASKFQIEDGDILYVSNSVTDRIDAVIQAFSPFAAPREVLTALQ